MKVEDLPDYTKGAVISADGKYRYYLERRWIGERPNDTLGFLMLNPSSADSNIDDPTIRRCVGFAHRMGYSGIAVVNLMAYRATKPKNLPESQEAIGPLRNYYYNRIGVFHCSRVVCAWGGKLPATFTEFDMGQALMAIGVDMLSVSDSGRFQCFGYCSNGAPRHPLMLPNDAQLEPFRLNSTSEAE